jgi:anti-sigma factor RsiW
MADTKPPDDREQEELIAYLDGELTEAEAQVLESKLHQDPRLRAEADVLRRTWALLDYLPRAEPSPTFTHRTLDRVTTMLPLERRGRRWLPGILWTVGILLAMAAGYLAGPWLLPAKRAAADAEGRPTAAGTKATPSARGRLPFPP